MRTPDVLVLGGGGILGEAWMSALLCGLEENERFAARECGSYLGTSAGSIVAALLAAGIDPRTRLGSMPEQPAVEAPPAAGHPGPAAALQAATVLGGATAGRLAWLALRSSQPAGRLARRAALARLPAGRRSLAGLGREVERTGASWDGRLRITAVELESGRRVIFDGSEASPPSVGRAIEASCAIPGVFRPVAHNGARFVDGGAWSPTNLDVAEVARGDRVLCLNPTGTTRSGVATAMGGLALISRSVAGLEAAALRSKGASVRVVAPDRDCVEAIGDSLMNAANRDDVIAAGLAQGRRLGRPRTAADPARTGPRS